MGRAYDRLCERFTELAHLAGAEELLTWDQQTYLPPKGHRRRAGQLAALAALVHRRLADPQVGAWCAEAEGEGLEPAARRNLALMAWRHRRAAALPESLAAALAEASAAAFEAWRAAREADDFGRFAPHLERVVALARERGRCLAGGGDPYAGLLEEYEPGLTPE
ncbi:MAG: carboxypeptidase M32, partial [Nitrospirae bacterium]